jgi:hypothetical protein
MIRATISCFDWICMIEMRTIPSSYHSDGYGYRMNGWERVLSDVGERLRVGGCCGTDCGQASGCASTARTAAGRRGLVAGRRGGRLRDRPPDYDVDHYARVLRDTYAARLARALAPAVFADPDQFSLFAPSTAAMRPVLVPRPMPAGGGMDPAPSAGGPAPRSNDSAARPV